MRTKKPSPTGAARLINILVVLAVLASLCTSVTFADVAPSSAATPAPAVAQDAGTEGKALVEFSIPNAAAVDDLLARGADLAEYVRDNGDGTLTINAVVTPSERALFESLGYKAGATIEDSSTIAAVMANRAATMTAEQKARAAAAKGATKSPNGFATPPEVLIQRADYFTNYAGSFLSVEAKDALDTTTGGPTLAMTWKVEGGEYVTPTVMSKVNDAGQYMGHRVLVRIGAAGTVSPVPGTVSVAADNGQVSEAPVSLWLGSDLPPMAEAYLTGFTTHYMDPVEIRQRMLSLANEFPNLAQAFDTPYQTNGYQRLSSAILNGTGAIGTQPASADRPSSVVLYAKAYGQNGGNNIQVELVNPGAPSAPLTLTVSSIVTQTLISVQLGTNMTGTLTSTAAAVVNLINTDAKAKALITAYTWAGNAGAGIVQPRARVNLSDFLNAPASYPRGPQPIQVLRIGKTRDGSKVGAYLFCQQHAREWATPLSCVETAERLLRNYAIDPTTKELVDNLDIFIVPVSNPDGAMYSMYDYNSQRKNMTDYCSPVSGTSTNGMPSSRNSWGVDVNRNDVVGTAWDGYSGASTTSCTSGTFAGPEPGSEPETKAVHWMVDTFSNIKFANDIHSYGGYFMWAPGAYKATGRETLPQANIGVSAYFMAVAERVESRIKESRGTAMLPERTGVVVDVLYSAAGNSGDYLWYNKGIIGYDFEAGADIFTSTITGTQQTGVGFQPTYDPEGQAEAMEFASGNYGLLETALDYAHDVTPPQTALVPDGGVSPSPIQATFQFVNEPSVIYYTLDGTTPTTSSQTWEAQGPRLPGQVFQFNETTTVKWIAKDMKGNVAEVQSARFVVDTVPPTTTVSLSPAPLHGYYVNPLVTLSADDGNGSGIAHTEYRLDGGAPITYSVPFRVIGDSNHVLDYQSVDLAGNVETTQTLTFTVRALPPAAYLPMVER